MSYILDGSTIRSPYDIEVTNSTQSVQNRTLSGDISRDIFGSNKRKWIFRYKTTKKADFNTINTIYTSYLTNAVAKTFESTEANYTIAQTNVHVDLLVRNFSVRGEDYLSDFDLILTEA